MIKLHSSPHTIEIHNLKNVLEGRGIKCEIRGEYLNAATGELPVVECWPELWIVDDSCLDESRELLADFTHPREVERSSWLCRDCGEKIEGQFSECWQCGATRPRADM